MIAEEAQKLKRLRDHLVGERRQMVDAILAEPHSSESMAGEFGGLQSFIDAVERALLHEAMLEQKAGPKSASPEKPLQ